MHPIHVSRLIFAACALIGCCAVMAQDSSTPPQNEESSAALDSILSDAAPAPASEQNSSVPSEPAANETTDAQSPVDPAAPVDVIAVPQTAKKEAAPTDQWRNKAPHAALEEIVVTATKRAESVREIPASVTALLGSDLEKQGVQGAEDILKLVPGVNMTTAGDSAARITIRGISADPGTNSTTAILFGDVSFTDNYLPFVTLDPNPFDMRTVEVLKGPQGTLFGAGALNGAVRYVPEPAKLGVFEVKYFGQYSKVTQGESKPVYGAAINIPLGEEWAFRAMGFDRQSAGYIDDTHSGKKDVNSIKQTGLRGMLRGAPTEQWDIKLMYAMQDTRIADTAVADNRNGNLSHGNRARPSPQNNKYWVGDLNVGYHMDWADFVSETAYIDKTGYQFFDATSRLIQTATLPLMSQIYNNQSQTMSQEFRLVSADDPDARWKWVSGVFASRQNIQSTLDTPVGDTNLPVSTVKPILDTLIPGLGSYFTDSGSLNLATLDTDVSVKELAAFGDITRRIGSDLEVSIGGRLYKTTSGGSVNQTGVLLTVYNMSPSYENKGTVVGQGFNPKASALWRVTDDFQLYAAISKGFRAGGLQPGFASPTNGQTAPPRFKADSLWNYEIGERSNWFDGTLHFDVSAFIAKWESPQILQVVSGTIPVPSSYITNVGSVDSRGIEATMQTLLPIPGFTLNASAAYTRTVTTANFIGYDGSLVPTGTAWPFAPRWQTATTLAYNAEISDWNLGANVTHIFIGRASNDLVLSRNRGVFGFTQWNLQLNAANTALTWLPEVSFVIDNLADKRGVSHIYDGGSYTDVTYIRPRSLNLRLTGRF